MAVRGALYRCHLFSFGGVQTPGFDCQWTQNLQSLGETSVRSGEIVELYSRVDGSLFQDTTLPRLRFDILEEDFFLGGGLDDYIVAISGPEAPPPEEGLRVDQREMEIHILRPGSSLSAAVLAYRARHTDAELMKRILIFDEQTDDAQTLHVVAWWLTEQLEDPVGGSEYYFVFNAEGRLDDKTETTLDVRPEVVQPERDRPNGWQTGAVLRTLDRLISRGSDTAVTNTILSLLESLSAEVLLETVFLLQAGKDNWNKLVRRVRDSQDAVVSDRWYSLGTLFEPNSGYLTAGDKLDLQLFTGSSVVPEDDGSTGFTDEQMKRYFSQFPSAGVIRSEFRQYSRSGGKWWVDLYALDKNIRERIGQQAWDALRQAMVSSYEVDPKGEVTFRVSGAPVVVKVGGLLPVGAANALAQAVISNQFYQEIAQPRVRLIFLERGSVYAVTRDRLANAAEGRAIPSYSTFVPDASSESYRRQDRRSAFIEYLGPAYSNEGVTAKARLRYLDWVAKNYHAPEFLTRTPADLWEWALREASVPPPESPYQKHINLMNTQLLAMQASEGPERERISDALHRYQAWYETHFNANKEAELLAADPYALWANFYFKAVEQNIRQTVNRQLAALAQPPPIDWDAVGAKLDEAIRFTNMNVRATRAPHVERGEIVEGGIGPFFQERTGVSYLIMPSEEEHKVRRAIADQYFSNLLARATQPNFTRLNITVDFADWVSKHPDHISALQLTASHPYSERSEYEVELEDWQTAVEIGIGFIPIVGSIVGVVEVTTGQSLLGRRLGPVERGITAAAILLPAAGKLFRVGKGMMTAAEIAATYRLSAREANAVYRACLHLRPGSTGEALLKRVLGDVEKGVPIRDPATARQVENLLGEMGMTERQTAEALSVHPTRSLSGAQVATESNTERSILNAFGGTSATYRGLTPSTRQAVRAAVEAEENLFRRAIQAETESGFNGYRQAVLDKMASRGSTSEQMDLVRNTLADLNHEFRAGREALTQPIARARIQELGELSRLQSAGDNVLQKLREREAFHVGRAADAALTPAQRRAAQTAALRQQQHANRVVRWLADPTARQRDLDRLQREVANSPYLREHVQNGGGDMLQSLWIQYLARPANRPVRVGFEEYVRILQRHYRGNFGEFEVAFRLGPDFILIKAPDSLVTLPGTDLIAIPKSGGPLLIIDNKALTALQVDAVDALTRNLPNNLGHDVEFLARLAREPNTPTHLRLALGRMQTANNAIRARVAGLTRDQIENATVQADIDAILRQNQIERVVTNAGGQVNAVSADLRAIGIDLLDMN